MSFEAAANNQSIDELPIGVRTSVAQARVAEDQYAANGGLASSPGPFALPSHEVLDVNNKYDQHSNSANSDLVSELSAKAVLDVAHLTPQNQSTKVKAHQGLRSVIQPGDKNKGHREVFVPDRQVLAGLPTTINPDFDPRSQGRDLKISKAGKTPAVKGHSGGGEGVVKSAQMESPRELSSLPASITKKSLEDNNHVYELIQAENAKRQNAVSDGSVQAIVLPVPEQRHMLRHRAKQDVLREDAYSTRNSLPSSVDNSSRKSKYRTSNTIPNESDTAITSQESSPSQKSQSKYGRSTNDRKRLSEIQNELQPAKTISPSSAASLLTNGDARLTQHHSLKRSSRQKRLDIDTPNREQLQSQASDTDSQRPRTSGLDDSPTLSYKGWLAQPKLRRSSHEARLERNEDIRRTSLNKESYWPSHRLDAKLEQAAKELTLEGRAISDNDMAQGEVLAPVKDSTTASPRHDSFNVNSLYPTQTALSVSQTSERSDIELCQARGIEIFPHNNDSLLVVQQISPLDRDPNSKAISKKLPGNAHIVKDKPTFTACVEGPTDPVNETSLTKHAPDSPFMRHGAAPKPPVINFIPPTPSRELEHQEGTPQRTNESLPAQRLTLSQKFRRYSGGLVQPFALSRGGSLRGQDHTRSSSMPEQRPTYLSSSWQRRDYWNEYDSDESEFEDLDPLPPGGDTSDVAESKRSAFPRNMSVRMPGFRGAGGFLVGNSLGIDRHGTNSRRHYVAQRTSAEILRQMKEERNGRIFTLPFSNGVRYQYVGLDPLREKLYALRASREERAIEKRRQTLRRQIGSKVYHHGPDGGPY